LSPIALGLEDDIERVRQVRVDGDDTG